MTTKTLSVKYTADASGVLRAQAQISRSAASLGSSVTNLGKSMYRTGRVMTVGLTLPIVAGFKVAVDEATQFNQVQAQTQAALKSTGGAANVTAGHITRLSARLGKLTAVDGEVVHSMENILLTFPAIRNEVGKGNRIFDRASLAVENLSARMGTDLNSAATFVGKALGNPVKGLTALTRVGVEFDAQQVKLITHMVKNGNVMGAQKVILAELNKEFGGSAKAMGDAASPLTKLNLAFRDFAQKIGPIVIPFIEKVTEWVGKLADWFTRLSPGVQKAVVIVLALVAALGPLLIVLGGAVAVIGTIIEVFNPWILAIAAVIAITILLIKNWDLVKSKAQTVWNAVEHAIGNALGDIMEMIATWVQITLDGFSLILHGAATAFGWIPGVGSKLKAARDAFDRFTKGVVDGLRAQANQFRTWGSQAARSTANANEQMRRFNATLLEVSRHSHIHVVIDQTGALHGGIQHRQGGGSVLRGHPYLVGEAGAELFVPAQNGRIMPHGSAGAAAAMVVNVYVAGTVTSERDLAETIRQQLILTGRRNGGSSRLGLS